MVQRGAGLCAPTPRVPFSLALPLEHRVDLDELFCNRAVEAEANGRLFLIPFKKRYVCGTEVETTCVTAQSNNLFNGGLRYATVPRGPGIIT